MSRRESSGEVLERNICFVDTPGYGSSDDVIWFNVILADSSSMMF
jgi:flagellar basal body rod protein FlgB